MSSATLTMRRALACKPTVSELRVLLAVLVEADQRDAVRTTSRELAEIVYGEQLVSKSQREHVSKALASLASQGIVQIDTRPGRGAEPVVILHSRLS